jgi:Fe-S-cluster containining protein
MDQKPLIERLHDKVDTQVSELENALPMPLHCRKGCADCCVDDLTVFEVEAERIRREFGDVLRGTPSPEGMCAFLSVEDRSCRIYSGRPYVCRTQGLGLRWFEEDEQTEEIVEYRDICPLNLDALNLELADEAQLWLIGPTEDELQRAQWVSTGDMSRVSLRDLFVGA